jgi:2,3-bisphosphoglycerate-independent phosphoglycerate mutase
MVESHKRVGIIMVLIDGLADYSNRVEAGRKTTLQEAKIPTLTHLINSEHSFFGVHDPV